MDPTAVLSEQQRQLRFRKVIERKKYRNNVNLTGSKKIKRSESRNSTEDVKTSFPLLPVTSHQHRQVLQQDTHLNKSTAPLQAKIKTIVQSYESTFAQSDDMFLDKVSISSTLNVPIFCTNIFLAAFL
jgi:hypothetical protein